MTVLKITLAMLYCGAAISLITYGLHMYVLTALFRRRLHAVQRSQQTRTAWYSTERPDEAWPMVTIQLPIYNEANVAVRVMEAAAAQDYPAERLEIQVLDDSDDETASVVDAKARDLWARGFDISVVRRASREGYKAGALAHGLRAARGEVIAIFDADFVPFPDFLRRSVPLLMDEPRNACVQGRWAHLNEAQSWLTRAQSLAIDGHFAVEQGGRAWNDLFMNFNGTAGIWRRAALRAQDVGGWTSDTLTEDLDISYRAQLAGWRIEYCMDIACPSELPQSVLALKTQQYRWAKGSIQCARKLLGTIWRSPIGLPAKLEATMHLTGYSISVWMLVLGLLSLPMWCFNPLAFLGGWLYVLAALMWLSLAGPPFAHLVSRHALGGGWSGFKHGALLMLVGVGLCLNTAIGCLAGLFLRGGEFVRTAKLGPAGNRRKRYRNRRSSVWIAELACSFYCAASFYHFVMHSQAIVGAFLAIFAVGFGIVGWLSSPFVTRDSRQDPGLNLPDQAVVSPASSNE